MSVVASNSDESLSSTQSTDWVEKLNASGEIGAGTYKLQVCCEYSSSSTTVGASVQVTLDGVEANIESYVPEIVADPCMFTTFGIANLTEGVHTLSLRYKANGAATAYIRRARLLVEKY